MSTPTLTTSRNQLRALALALVERAERRAATLGGEPHELVTRAEFEALRAALKPQGEK